MESSVVAFMRQLHRKGEEAGREAIEKLIRDNAPQARDMGVLAPTLESAIRQIAVGIIFGAIKETDLTKQEKIALLKSISNVVRECTRRNGGTVISSEENN